MRKLLIFNPRQWVSLKKIIREIDSLPGKNPADTFYHFKQYVEIHAERIKECRNAMLQEYFDF